MVISPLFQLWNYQIRMTAMFWLPPSSAVPI